MNQRRFPEGDYEKREEAEEIQVGKDLRRLTKVFLGRRKKYKKFRT